MFSNRWRADTFATAALNGCYPEQRSNTMERFSTIRDALP